MDKKQKQREYAKEWYARKKATDPRWYEHRKAASRQWSSENPETRKQMMRDYRMMRKRTTKGTQEPDKTPAARLKRRGVKEIKRLLFFSASFAEIAKIYSTGISTIADIYYGYSWRHVRVPEFDKYKRNQKGVRVDAFRRKKRRFTAEQVKEIRKSKDTSYSLAKKCGGVTMKTIKHKHKVCPQCLSHLDRRGRCKAQCGRYERIEYDENIYVTEVHTHVGKE